MTKTSLNIRGPRILILDDEVQNKTDWGLELVEDLKIKRSSQVVGTVIQIGDESYHDYDNPWCKVGDKVFYAQYAGKIIEDPVTKTAFKIVNDIDIIATIDKVEDNG